jgi:oligoribonuclease NrnB/cAMP/cGMP phosphodiesterase (DHH superfamily)
MNKNITVFAHNDLDGVVSYLILCWLYKQKLSVIPTTPSKLDLDYNNWQKNNIEVDKLFFLDLDTSKIGNQIDNKKTIIIDHHKTNIYSFKEATTIICNESSCAKLLYNTFFKKELSKQLTNEQKTLIALADDWDSNTKATPLSEKLNIIYHSTTNKFSSFVEDYYDGFKPFDKFKQNTIILYKKHCSEYLSKLSSSIYIGEVNFEDTIAKVGAVFCNKFVQECCDYLFERYNVDISIAVLLEQKRIAVRRNVNNNIDITKFVQRIAQGGGHEAAAGGSLTDEFIEFTKHLKPVN